MVTARFDVAVDFLSEIPADAQFATINSAATISFFTPDNVPVVVLFGGSLLNVPTVPGASITSVELFVAEQSLWSLTGLDVPPTTIDPSVIFDNPTGFGNLFVFLFRAFGGDDSITGSAFDDVILGMDGRDTIDGGDGNDALFADTVFLAAPNFASDDTVRGGDRVDTLDGGPDGDLLDGGADFDYATYAFSPQAVQVDLGAATQSGGDAQGDRFISIEGVLGSEYNDSIVGDDGPNELVGYGGIDTLRGGGNQDTLNGAEGADSLFGEAGNDVLRGGPEGDTLDGGEGRDVASYFFAQTDIFADLSDAAQNTGEAAGDVYVSIEGLAGGEFDDTLIGTDFDDVLQGDLGNDDLQGGLGNDLLDGGLLAPFFDSPTPDFSEFDTVLDGDVFSFF